MPPILVQWDLFDAAKILKFWLLSIVAFRIRLNWENNRKTLIKKAQSELNSKLAPV